MYIRMKQDHQASYNGVDHRVYKAGEIYSAEHANERYLFPILVGNGYAEYYDPALSKKETKIITPKAKKIKKA